MDKILKKHKVDFLKEIYFDINENDIPILNQIIIDSIGLDGLKLVKKKAWENHY